MNKKDNLVVEGNTHSVSIGTSMNYNTSKVLSSIRPFDDIEGSNC